MKETYEVRPIDPDDVEALRRMFFRLSADSVYRRFFRPVLEPSATVLWYLTAVDHDSRDALVAVVDGEVVAVARYDRRVGCRGQGGEVGATDEAEVAVVVEDAWQGRRIGQRLVEELGALAESRGMRVFIATILGDNRAASGLLHAVDRRPEVRIDHGELLTRSQLRRPA